MQRQRSTQLTYTHRRDTDDTTCDKRQLKSQLIYLSDLAQMPNLNGRDGTLGPRARRKQATQRSAQSPSVRYRRYGYYLFRICGISFTILLDLERARTTGCRRRTHDISTRIPRSGPAVPGRRSKRPRHSPHVCAAPAPGSTRSRKLALVPGSTRSRKLALDRPSTPRLLQHKVSVSLSL